jgi:hypothetical protein
MVAHMKTTIELSGALLTRAKAQAARQKTTLRALIEEGLRRLLDSRPATPPFRLRDASFRGDGLQPPLAEGDWERIRELTYTGRGG